MVLCDRIVATQMLIEKLKLPLIDIAAGLAAMVMAANTSIPGQVAPGTDVEPGVATYLLGLSPEIKTATKVRVAPALQQQHRSLQSQGSWLVLAPACAA